jgi:hypothetical protein
LNGPFHNQGTLIPDQHQVAFSQGGNTLSQSLQGLSPGSNYRLQFYYDARACCGEDRRLDFKVYWNDQLLSAFSDVQPVGSGQPYRFHSVDFTPELGEGTLSFVNGGAGDRTLLLDAVSLQPVIGEAVMVANPGFEASGRVFGYLNQGASSRIAGWDINGQGSIVDAVMGVGSRSHDSQWLALAEGATAGQTLQGLVPGKNYHLLFDAAGSFSVYLNGQALLSQQAQFASGLESAAAMDDMQTYHAVFTAQSPSQRLEFVSQQGVELNHVEVLPFGDGLVSSLIAQAAPFLYHSFDEGELDANAVNDPAVRESALIDAPGTTSWLFSAEQEQGRVLPSSNELNAMPENAGWAQKSF